MIAPPLHDDLLRTAARARGLLNDDAVVSIADFVRSRFSPDGGICGRGEDSDIYFTFFGLSCLRALGCADLPPNATSFLASFTPDTDLDLVHSACLIRSLSMCSEGECRFTGRIAARREMERHRTRDGGYRASTGDRAGSAYGCYLAMSAYDALGILPPRMAGVERCIRGLATADGAFANDVGMDQGTTTATAAAVVVLTKAGAETGSAVGEWLADRFTPPGGFTASPRTPVPDLLSTATALNAMATLGLELVDFAAPCREFIEGLWAEDGGFVGHPLDRTADCEYTFYALLTLGQLADAGS